MDFKSYLVYQLMHNLGGASFGAVIFYSLTRGFYTIGSHESTEFFKSLTQQDIIEIRISWNEDAPLPYAPPPKQVIEGRLALQIIGQLLRQNQRKLTIVIDYAESLVPKETSSLFQHEKITYLEMLKDFSHDPGIRSSKNMLILITEDKSYLEDNLFQGEFYHPIEIELPSEKKRLSFLNFRTRLEEGNMLKLPRININDFPGKDNDKGLESLARGFYGFAIRSIDSFIRHINTHNYRLRLEQGQKIRLSDKEREISREEIKDRRQYIIANDSNGLLKEVRPRGGFNCVGNLTYIKKYFEMVAQALRENRVAIVPKAVLLAGPPGTGKSILAEGLAKEAGIPMVKLGNIQNMYVGESERNLEHVLKILLQMEPVLVFVDEIDQMIGQRLESTAGGGAERTEARMFGRLLEFMGDDQNRGKVLWIGATNRPDKLDDAMLRRFDRRFPVLIPYSNESRFSILEAFADKVFENKRIPGTIPGLEYDKEIDLKQVAKKMNGLTGSEMEQVVRDAIALQANTNSGSLLTQKAIDQAVDRFITSRNEDMYDFQTYVSLNMCNNVADLPEIEDLPDWLRKIIEQLKSKDNQAKIKKELSEKITQLRTKLLFER